VGSPAATVEALNLHKPGSDAEYGFSSFDAHIFNSAELPIAHDLDQGALGWGQMFRRSRFPMR